MRIPTLLNRPWPLAVAMTVLYALAIVFCFRAVLAPDVVFVAPDAPIAPIGFGDALRQLFTSAPTLQNLVFLLPYRFAYEGTFWVDAYVMCLAAVFLLRGRGSSWGAAWTGGFCAAFAGYFFTLFCAGHRGVVDALAVTCLCFGALLRGIRTRQWRWFALLGVFLAFGLAAQADLWLLCVCALIAYAFWLWLRECPCNALGPDRKLRCFRCGRTAITRRIVTLGARFTLTAAVFLVVGWPALLHTFRDAQTTRTSQLEQAGAGAQTEAQSAEAQWRFVTDWSLPPEDLLEFFAPDIHGHTSYPFDPAPYTGRMGSAMQILRQHSVHIGWVTLLLAFAAIFRRREPSAQDLPFWWGLTFVTLILALGRYTPLYRLVTALPFLEQVRAPVKWLHLTGFALAVLAGIGAEGIVHRFGNVAALLLCTLVALNGTLVARPYIFPRDLSHNALTAAVPQNATLWNAVRWPALDALCRWHGIAQTDDPMQADVAVTRAPQSGIIPLATLTVQGQCLGLYRLK